MTFLEYRRILRLIFWSDQCVGDDQDASGDDQEHGNVLEGADPFFHEHASADHGKYRVHGKDGIG